MTLGFKRFNQWEYRDFALLQASRLPLFICMSMLSVAVGWHIYDLTNSALDLGYVGLATFVPKLVFSFVGGDIADRFNRLRITNIALGLLAIGVSCLFWISSQGIATPATIMVAIGFNSAVNSIGSPAGTALMTHLVRPERLTRAIAWGSTLWQGAAIAGPALGGIVYGIGGSAVAVYGVCAGAAFGAFVVSLFIRMPSYSIEVKGNMWSRVKEGAAFVFAERVIFGAISLDLFAVLLGGAVALMPIYARDILKLGPDGLGILRSAPAVGAALMAALLAIRPIGRTAGRKMFWAVLIFGAATCVFALSRWFWLSAAALAVLGAADMISVVIRHTLVQSRTPQNMRGRVSAVNQVFIGASNELGEFESGITAHWFGAEFAALFGGVGTILICLIWRRKFPDLFNTDKI